MFLTTMFSNLYLLIILLYLQKMYIIIFYIKQIMNIMIKKYEYISEIE